MAVITSKKLQFKEAHQHAELRIVERDLLHCEWCCNYFLSRGTYINTLSDPKDRAIFASMLIAYRRSIHGDLIQLSELSDYEKTKHGELLKVANQHVAHPVNRMEQEFTTLQVTTDENGNITKWGGLSGGGSGVSGAPLAEVETLKSLAQKIRNNYVKKRRGELEEILKKKISELTKADVQQLPDGITKGLRAREYMKQRSKGP